LELCILASGSGGNASVLRTPQGTMLIDAGVGPRTCAKRLEGTGVSVNDIRAICLTHLDYDHINPGWINTIIARGIEVYCHASRVEHLLARVEEWELGSAHPDGGKAARLGELVRPFEDEGAFEPLPEVQFRPLAFAHDQDGSHGFLISGQRGRIGYATDLGRVTEELLSWFCDVHVLALESNYDPQMEEESPRPRFLKQRIMSGHGHLSNHQAYAAVRQILDRCQRPPAHIVLLHRSRQCNCPKLLRKLFAQDPRIGPRLTLAEQYERTQWLRSQPSAPLDGEQLALAWD
jgi:phosphoribosyl 1,2-cyclic phosphodiesterase